MDIFREQLLTTQQIHQNLTYVLCTDFPKKGVDFAKLSVFPNFYPNLPIFLHGYIRHIGDILQL